MEPEVHIIEKYFQEVLHCLTMSNIKCEGNKEIDLLAINPKTLEKYHVEARVTTSFKLRSEATHVKSGTWKGRSHRNGIDSLAKEKFNHPYVQKKINEIFNTTNYNKVLIVWDIQNESVIEESKRKYGINVWLMKKVLSSLIIRSMGKGKKYPKGSRDDVLRMLEFLALGFEIAYGKQKKGRDYHENPT